MKVSRYEMIRDLVFNLIVINGMDPQAITGKQAEFLATEKEKMEKFSDQHLENCFIINCG